MGRRCYSRCWQNADFSRLNGWPNSVNPAACFMSTHRNRDIFRSGSCNWFARSWITDGPRNGGCATHPRKQNRCYALLSDGECNEGSIWEAAMFAAGQNVDHLTAIIDYNKWQATGRSQEILKLEPLAAKWEAFGWHAQQIDGHDFEAISEALMQPDQKPRNPA